MNNTVKMNCQLS